MPSPNAISPAARPIREAPRDPFHLSPEFKTESRGFGATSLILWGFVLLGGFFAVSAFSGDFANMRAYGVDENGLNTIFSLSDNEILFFVVLLLLIPASVFWAAALGPTWGARAVSTLATWTAEERGRRGLLIGTTVFAGAAITAVALLVLHQTPVTDDENVYLFQSRILATGQLTLPSLDGDDRIFEDNVFLVNNGRIFGQYPFGQSLFLLPGALLGYPRLMPLLAALATLWGLYLLGGELFDRRTGLLAAFLAAVSPMFWCMSATLLSHPTTLFALTWFAYFTARAVKSKTIIDGVAACLFFGLAFYVRSATTLVMAFPTALLLAGAYFVDLRRRGADGGEIGGRVGIAVGRRYRAVTAMAVVMAAVLGSYLAFNWIVNGSPWITNYHAVWLGKLPYDKPFGFDRGAWKIVHTPEAGFQNLLNNFLKLNVWALGWPISFAPMVALFASRRFRWVDLWLAFPILFTFAVYIFYFWPGVSDAGPVLYYELLLPMALLSARGVFAVVDWWKARRPADAAAGITAVFVAASIFFAAASSTQTFLRALSGVTERVLEPETMVAERGIDAGVVFVDYYVKGDFQDSWVAGRPDTSPRLGDRLHWVLNYGPERDRAFMERHFPGQPAHVLWWTEEGDPRLVSLDDYDESYVVRNYPDAR